MIPEKIQKLADLLTRLPSIGPRQALRLAFFIAGGGVESSRMLADAIADLAEIRRCDFCFRIMESNSGLCEICTNPKRDQGMLAIVEKETDMTTLENTHQYSGRYLIFGQLARDGILSKEHRQRLAGLKSGAPKTGFKEIIVAFSPTTLGDINASVLKQELSSLSKTITRLGRGIPTGGEVEFADEETLQNALKNRG